LHIYVSERMLCWMTGIAKLSFLRAYLQQHAGGVAQRRVGWRWDMGVAKRYVVALSICVLGAGCRHMPRDSATGQFAGPSSVGSFAAGRGGSGGTARTIHFAEVARSPDARTTGPIKPRTFEEYREPRPQPPPPDPNRSRKAFSASPPATVLPLRFEKCVAKFPCAFDGVVQDACATCITNPPDPNAAAGAGRIVQVVNNVIQVTNRLGAVQCGGPVTLNGLLQTLDRLTDPRVQFDNINQRFSLVVTVSSPNPDDTPALWVAATQNDDPCGTWFAYRMTFHGDATPPGTFLDFPMLAQDTRSLLLSTRNCLASKGCGKFIVFAIPKALIYTAAHVDFPYFNVDSLTAPVTHAGQPMVESGGVSFFLAAVPDMGYKVYVLVQTPFGAALGSRSFSSPFSKPSREARQPGTSVALDSSDGNITSSPYFDSTRIWFTHVVDQETFPTVRYGAINLRDVTVSIAHASHSPWSDDFNPSLAVVLSPPRQTLYLTWASTDAVVAQTATSAVAVAVDAAQPLKNLFGVATAYATGGNALGAPSSTVRFGDYSSVSVDPTMSDCAFATQQYFGANGSWRTRIAPMGICGGVVIQP
jgi:hypothetical protein